MDLWRIAHKKDLYPLIDYISREEWKQMHFSSRLYNYGAPSLPAKYNSRIYLHIKDSIINGALCWTASGSLFPAFEPENLTYIKKMETMEMIRQMKRRIYAVIGMENRVRFIETALSDKTAFSVNYRIMTFSGDPGDEYKNHLVLRKAGPADLNRLLPLEISYQLEEVLLDPNELDPEFVRSSLQKQLTNEWFYTAEKEKVSVAKAGTNAIGFGFCQMGGVFTIPEERKKGVGSDLIRFMLKDLYGKGKQCCLFVKDNNIPALKLYSKIGFNDQGSFRISYYR